MANLHGKSLNHQALVEEDGYTSPDEYADQGDTRVIRDLMFSYTTEVDAGGGAVVISATEAMRGDEVTLEQIGQIALQKGEASHSFYTTKELDSIRNPGSSEASAAEYGNVSDLGEYELAEWLTSPSSETGKAPTINEVLEEVGDDKEYAHRMLQAENIASDGDPRKGLEQGLTRIIQGGE